MTRTLTIDHTVYSSHLGDDVSRDESTAYADAVQAAIEAAYPDADVIVDLRHRVSGVGAGTKVYADDDSDCRDIKDDVDAVAARIFEAGAWRSE